MLVPPTCYNKEGEKYLSHMVCQCGGTGKGIKSKVGGELELSLQALFTYLCDLNVQSLLWSYCFQQVMGPHMWVAWLEVWLLVCIERDLEVLCLLEVQVFTSGGFLEALLEPWRSFEELWRSFEVLEPIWSLEVHNCLIGALWRYLEALDLHVCTFQHCKSWFESLRCICAHLIHRTLDLSWLSAFWVFEVHWCTIQPSTG
jgi:hypothetical protein